MHGINGNGFGMGWGMGFGWLFILIIVVGAIWFFNRSARGNEELTNQNTAIEILKKRYASGEIDKEEYNRLKNDIL